MVKTLFVLSILLAASFTKPIWAQSPETVTFKVTVVDDNLNLKNVPKLPLLIRKLGPTASAEIRVTTSLDGKAIASLLPGYYLVVSERPLMFQSRTLEWQVNFAVESGGPATFELSSDNAKISADLNKSTNRDISRGGEMFRTLRDGVVTVYGELEPGTGFIIDDAGLVLTNQHVIDQSNDIRVRFDKSTAVRARVLAVDKERDLAVLQINLSAFPRGRILNLATNNSAEKAVVEGEHVFTIGSPLHHEKILSTGIVSKIENGGIITNITFNPGNSGAPLFNSLGTVVGINTFKIRDRSGSVFAGNETTAADASGLSGIVAIEEAAAVIAKARSVAATKGLPSAELMPNMPDGVFPLETIKAALRDKNFPLKPYVSDVKNYQIKYMTPVYKFYIMEKDRIESMKNRDDRNKEKGLVDADPFRDLRYWSEYAGELRPVVQILALPETGATGASMALSVISQGIVGYGTPLNHKYKADFYQMKLLCDRKEIIPLIRNKTEIVRELQNYYKDRKRFTYAGVYSYPYEVFAPGHCRQMQVQVFSEEDLETPITSDVSEATKNRIWADFQDFRTKTARNEIQKNDSVKQ